MGISIYLLTDVTIVNEDDVDFNAEEDVGDGKALFTIDNPDFWSEHVFPFKPGQKCRAKYDETASDFHTSYGYYGRWREQLAQLVSRKGAECDTEQLFTELINFSDCEYYIGPITSAKLAEDFSSLDSEALSYSKLPTTLHEFYKTYSTLHKLFLECAKNQQSLLTFA